MNASGLRIVHVFRAPLGGLFRHVVDLASEQSARGHAVGMFFDSAGKDARVETAIAGIPGGLKLGVGVAEIGRNPSFSDIAGFLKFRRWLAQVRPHVIQGHGAKGGLYARLAGIFSKGANPPIIAYTPHGGSFNYRVGSLRHAAYMKVENALARHTDLFLFESDFIAARFRETTPNAPDSTLCAYNGLRELEFEPVDLADDAGELLYIGELREAKGVDTLIDALAQLHRDGRSGLRLAIVGSGPDRAAFEQRVARHGLDAFVKFHGPLPARHAFALGDVLVVASRQESLPYIVLEAAAAAKSIVATSVGGIPEIFGPFASRLIAPDNVAALSQAIGSTLDENVAERARTTLGLRSYVAGRFSVSTMTDSALAAYGQALQRRRSPDAALKRLRTQG